MKRKNKYFFLPNEQWHKELRIIKVLLVLFYELAGTGIFDFDLRGAEVDDAARGGDVGVEGGSGSNGDVARAVVLNLGFLCLHSGSIESGRAGTGNGDVVGRSGELYTAGVCQRGGDGFAGIAVEREGAGTIALDSDRLAAYTSEGAGFGAGEGNFSLLHFRQFADVADNIVFQ